MTSKTRTEEFLKATSLPEQTKSYTVISHGFIIDKMRTLAEKEGFEIELELFKSGEKGNEALGFMQLKTTSDEDMGMTFNWTNSYNKKLRFSCSVGGFIYDNKVPFVSSFNEASWLRKHTGTALDESELVMIQMIEQAQNHFKNIIQMKNKFIGIDVDKKLFGEIMGGLYFENDYINSEQVNHVKREYEKPSYDYKNKGTLWGLYKIIMDAVKDTDPTKWYSQQLKLNTYMNVRFNLDRSTIHEQDLDTRTVEEKIEEISFLNVLSEEQIEMVEKEYAYAFEKVGVKPYPLDEESEFDKSNEEGDFGKPINQINHTNGEVTLKAIPEEEKSEELQEIDEILNEKAQPAVSFFDAIKNKDAIENKIPITTSESFVKETIEEQEKPTCDNCGSENVSSNSSGQVLCDNCGHEEEDEEPISSIVNETFDEEPEFVFDEEEENAFVLHDEDDEEVLTEEDSEILSIDESVGINTIKEFYPNIQEGEYTIVEQESYSIVTINNTFEMLVVEK